MIELEPEDYNCILHWFERAFGRSKLEDMTLENKRTFWKLTFLAEDKLKEIKEEHPTTD